MDLAKPRDGRANPAVAVVGCGGWGRHLVRNLHSLGALSAVVDRCAAARQRALQLAPSIPVYEQLEQALGQGIDAIAIATPAETHAQLCEVALRAGKDVFCEKPLALTLDDATRVVALSEQTGRLLFTGHLLEYHPAVLKLRELIGEGALGEVRYLYSNRLNLGKVRRGENILWSFAPHDIAVILRLADALPRRAIAAGATFITPRVADVTVSQLQFSNGRAAHIFVSWLNPFKEQRLVVVGSRRMAVFDDVRKELILHDQRIDLSQGDPVPIRGDGTRIDYAADEPLRCECRAFLAALQTRQPPITDTASTLRVMAVLDALQRSLAAGGEPMSLAAADTHPAAGEQRLAVRAGRDGR